MEKFSKKHKMLLYVVILLLLTAAGSYLFAPHIEGIVFRMKQPFEEWTESCRDKSSMLLRYASPYWGGFEEGVYEPSSDAVVFTSNDVIEIDNGIYITGCHGLTDWCVMLHIYSRSAYTMKEPAQVEGEYLNWPFYMTCNGVEESEFPFVRNTENSIQKAFAGYRTNVFLAAPARIGKDGIITVQYYTGENYSEVKEIEIPVSYKTLE